MEIEQLLTQSLQLLGLGMGAVFTILILMIGLITLVSKIVPAEAPATPAPMAMPPVASNDHITAITAAVHQYRKSR